MSVSESGRHSREFMLKAVERLEAGERASALAIELNLQRTIVYHWRDRFRAHGAEGLTSKRGRPRTPDVLSAEGVRASRARADSLTQARAQIAELERKVGQQQLDGSVKNLGRYAASWIACWPKPQRLSSTAALTCSTRGVAKTWGRALAWPWPGLVSSRTVPYIAPHPRGQESGRAGQPGQANTLPQVFAAPLG